jgi:hypothetical protein
MRRRPRWLADWPLSLQAAAAFQAATGGALTHPAVLGGGPVAASALLLVT